MAQQGKITEVAWKIVPFVTAFVLSLLFEFTGLWYLVPVAGVIAGIISETAVIMAISTIVGAVTAYAIAIAYVLYSYDAGYLLELMGNLIGLGATEIIVLSLILAAIYVFLGGCIGYFTKMAVRRVEK
ncbi:MAG: hypothetical protein ACTSXX_13040 [Candidatus Baldrarchaeia archaeon]